ncbi:hypothetical protein Y032_0007g3494 [Ancylostoma ceylanicum]|uniref:Uncharacterized protein n=1 Tax=Ancylostoma ceylanicum TaxID=53326 RepID=A0A016VNB2_9BILA|nr:hypothetical protein Y032_0007g3494 [Ancylostoma ceylanicum]
MKVSLVINSLLMFSTRKRNVPEYGNDRCGKKEIPRHAQLASQLALGNIKNGRNSYNCPQAANMYKMFFPQLWSKFHRLQYVLNPRTRVQQADPCWGECHPQHNRMERNQTVRQRNLS